MHFFTSNQYIFLALTSITGRSPRIIRIIQIPFLYFCIHMPICMTDSHAGVIIDSFLCGKTYEVN